MMGRMRYYVGNLSIRRVKMLKLVNNINKIDRRVQTFIEKMDAGIKLDNIKAEMGIDNQDDLIELAYKASCATERLFRVIQEDNIFRKIRVHRKC